MLPESTEPNTIEQIQLEEDARLFGMRVEPRVQEVNDFDMAESSTYENTYGLDNLTNENAFGDRERPSTGNNITVSPSTLELMTKKHSASSELPKSSLHEPPIYAWLADTEPSEDPESVLRWCEAEEGRRVKRQKKVAEDLEVFRNVEIAVPLKDDVPMRDNQNRPLLSHAGPSISGSGAYMLYRNILDQYPKLEDSLAWRFANSNWNRMEDMQEKQLGCSASPPNQTEPPGRPMDHASQGSVSSSADNEFPSSPRLVSSSFSNPWKKRKTCSLPPQPRPPLVHSSDSVYSVKCYMCH
jgi:hypothetical protein